MVQFKAFEEGIQVNGTTIMSIVDGMEKYASLGKKYLIKAGLPENIINDAEHWYSQQLWLDVFKTISTKVGENTLFLIGKKIPENAVFPPEIDNIEKALSAIDVAYHMNHRNADSEVLFDPSRPPEKIMLEGIGHYGHEKVSDTMALMICENPYPCDFDRGIITTMAQRFNKSAGVSHDDSKPCRKNDADSCTYIVTWRILE